VSAPAGGQTNKPGHRARRGRGGLLVERHTSSSGVAKGGTTSYGFVSGSQPNCIFPCDSPAYSSVANVDDLQQPLYRPPHWSGGQNDQPTVGCGLSVADAPVYSDGGKAVVINMKGWKWQSWYLTKS
jgi:hypothetical protein